MFNMFKRKKNGFEQVSETPFKICPSCHMRTGKYDISCLSCGATLEKESFCTCGAKRPEGSTYCSFCGLDDFGIRKRRTEFSDSQEVWQRKDGDFATVFTQAELQGQGFKQFVINPGTSGLLYQRGRFVGMLTPGAHPFKSLGDRFSRFSDKDAFTLVLMDVGDMVLPFVIEDVTVGSDIFSFDKKSIDLKLIFRMENPDFFQLNVIKDQKHLALNWLRDRILSGMTQRIKEFVKSNPAVLEADDFRQKLHVMLLDHFEDSLDRMGMKLVDIEASVSSFSSVHDDSRNETLFELKGRFVELQNAQSIWEMERRERESLRKEDQELFGEEKEESKAEHQREMERVNIQADQLREMQELILSGKRNDLTLTEKEIDFFYEKGELELKQADKDLILIEQSIIRDQKRWLVDFKSRRRELENKSQDQDLDFQEIAQDAKASDRKLGVLESLLTNQNREKMLNLKSVEDWNRFRQEVDRNKIIDERDWEETIKAAQRKTTEDDSAWEHLQRVLELQRSSELKRIQDLQQKDNLQAGFDSEVLGKQHENKLDDLDGQRAEDAFKRTLRMEASKHQSHIGQKTDELDLEFKRKERELGVKRAHDQADFEDQQRRLQMTMALEDRKHQQKMQEKTRDHEQSLDKAKAFNNLSIEALLANIPDPGMRESIIKTMQTRYEGENMMNLSKNQQKDLQKEVDKLQNELIHKEQIGNLEKSHFQEIQQTKDQLQGENKEALKTHIEDLKEEHDRERKGTHALTDSVMKGAAGVAAGSKPQATAPEKLQCKFCDKPTVLFPGDTRCSHCGGSLK